MPGAPGGSSGSKKLKAYNVWDVLGKLLGTKEEEGNPEGEAEKKEAKPEGEQSVE
jgi:hypothetical protein